MSFRVTNKPIITNKQAAEIKKLQYYGYVVAIHLEIGTIRTATVNDVIDWLRKKYNVVIYNSIEPFVDPTGEPKAILYRYSVKYCNLRDGWNGREYIGESKLTKNIYAAKREAITLAIRWLKKKGYGKKEQK